MIRYLLQVIQSSLGAAVITALLFAYAPKGRGKKLALSCFAGSLGALALAVLRRTTAVNMGKVSNFTAALVITAGLVFSAFILLSKKKRMPPFIDIILAFLLLFYTLPVVFLYPAEFLLAGESPFSTDFLFKCIGWLAGLGLSLLAGFTMYKTGQGMGKTLHIILSAVLLITIVHQSCTVLQFLFARRIIPMNRTVFRLLTPALNNPVFFLYGILAVTFVLPVLSFASSLHQNGTFRNPAERRKSCASALHRRRLCLALAVSYAAALFSLTALKTWSERSVELSPAEPYTLAGDEIIIPLERIEDGHLHRYNYTAADTIAMRFIIIKKNESAYGVGLDACDICGPTGYYERKDEVICRLCDVVMNKATIGFQGGCNPVPLGYTMRSGNLIISTESLESERARFK